MGQVTVESPLGPLVVTSGGGAITALDWGRATVEAPDPLLEDAACQLDAYFMGRRLDFDLPLAPRGTPFRQSVWAAMSRIPYGRVTTYGDLARELGSAARAVGGACGANPIPIIIPCHRVVGGRGSAGGYSGAGGLITKDWLLRMEQKHRVVAYDAMTDAQRPALTLNDL